MPATMVQHEEGFIACCSLCDSYFVLTTSLISPAHWRGRGGTKLLDERNERIQQRWALRRCLLLRCPTCVELITALPYLEWIETAVRDLDSLMPLSPCWLVKFEEDQPPPLYLDHHPRGEAGKPKWKLASGVGPAGLELDSSRSNRLWKPSLKQFGIVAQRYEQSLACRNGGASHHKERCSRVETALGSLTEAAADALAEAMHAARPLYESHRWETVAEQIDELVAAAEVTQRDADIAVRAGWSEKQRRQEESCARRDVAAAGLTVKAH